MTFCSCPPNFFVKLGVLYRPYLFCLANFIRPISLSENEKKKNLLEAHEKLNRLVKRLFELFDLS